MKDLRATIEELTTVIEERIPNNDRIMLRRAEVKEGARTMAFARLCVMAPLAEAFRDVPAQELEDREKRWSVIVGIIASCGQGSSYIGSALVAARVNETRVLRLLRARDSRLWTEARRVCEQVSRVAGERESAMLDLTLIAALILSDGRPDEEDVRLKIAKSYYDALRIDQSK